MKKEVKTKYIWLGFFLFKKTFYLIINLKNKKNISKLNKHKNME